MHREKRKKKSVQQANFFLRYVDDIVRTVKGDPRKSATGIKLTTFRLTVHNRDTKHKREIGIFGFEN